MKCLCVCLLFCVIFHVSTSNHVEHADLSSVLECCDLSSFIEDSFGKDCDFKLGWTSASRLFIYNNTSNNALMSTTTAAPIDLPVIRFDLQVIPQTCEIEECIFKELQIVSNEGVVDHDAFTKLLDNMTRDNPDWASAKARVLSTCLTRPLNDYEADCEINKVLACTLDVLSENCPHHKEKDDICKSKNGTTPSLCQISTSKLRPKKRRNVCEIPSMVDNSVLKQCGANSISYQKYLRRPVKMIKQFIRKPKQLSSLLRYKPSCISTMESSKCVMNKMGVLNKYGFVDYFKMKNKIRNFTTENGDWKSLQDTLLNIFTSSQFYGTHCTSQRKLLNVIDTMLSTCPQSRKKNTIQCDNFFTRVRLEPQITESQKKLNYILSHIRKSYHPRPLLGTPFRYSAFAPTNRNSNLNIEKTTPATPIGYSYYTSYVIPLHNNGSWMGYSQKGPLVLVPVYKREQTTKTSK